MSADEPDMATIALPASTEERITFAPSEMSSSAAPSSIAIPAARMVISAESRAMFWRFPMLKNTWFGEIRPKNTIRPASISAIHVAGSEKSQRTREPSPSPGPSTSSAGSASAVLCGCKGCLRAADHGGDDPRDRRVRRGHLLRDGAVPQHDDPVRELQHPRHVVGDDEDAQPSVGRGADRADDDVRLARPERGGRLVH